MDSRKTLGGNKRYHQLARLALPILVRQAKAAERLYYSDLASELRMANPRNTNHVLGTIGNALKALGKEWEDRVPPIQCLVVNKATGIPGEGIGWFLTRAEQRDHFWNSSQKIRERIIEQELNRVFSYRYWDDVLEHFFLKPAPRATLKAGKAPRSAFGGSGVETTAHKRLKEYVARHPEFFGLQPGSEPGEVEHRFGSGDEIDVLFKRPRLWIGIEVKTESAADEEIQRGLYQTVKYKALIAAEQSVEQAPQNARVLLVMGRAFPQSLVPLRNTLRVEVARPVQSRDRRKTRSS